MGRRVIFTIIVANLALMLALPGDRPRSRRPGGCPSRPARTARPGAPGAATPKIVGGTAVPDGKYKFQAALLAQSFGTNDFRRQYCGGSLITPFEVLTAAHCVDFVGVPGGSPSATCGWWSAAPCSPAPRARSAEPPPSTSTPGGTR